MNCQRWRLILSLSLLCYQKSRLPVTARDCKAIHEENSAREIPKHSSVTTSKPYPRAQSMCALAGTKGDKRRSRSHWYSNQTLPLLSDCAWGDMNRSLTHPRQGAYDRPKQGYHQSPAWWSTASYWGCLQYLWRVLTGAERLTDSCIHKAGTPQQRWQLTTGWRGSFPGSSVGLSLF